MKSVGQNASISRAPKRPNTRDHSNPKPKNSRMAISHLASQPSSRWRAKRALNVTVATMPTALIVNQMTGADPGARCVAEKPRATSAPQAMMVVLADRYHDDCFTLRAIDSISTSVAAASPGPIFIAGSRRPQRTDDRADGGHVDHDRDAFEGGPNRSNL